MLLVLLLFTSGNLVLLLTFFWLVLFHDYYLQRRFRNENLLGSYFSHIYSFKKFHEITIFKFENCFFFLILLANLVHKQVKSGP